MLDELIHRIAQEHVIEGDAGGDRDEQVEEAVARACEGDQRKGDHRGLVKQRGDRDINGKANDRCPALEGRQAGHQDPERDRLPGVAHGNDDHEVRDRDCKGEPRVGLRLAEAQQSPGEDRCRTRG